MNVKRILVIVAGIVIVAVGVYYGYLQIQEPSPTAEPTTVANTNNQTNTRVINTNRGLVSAEGQIVPLQYARLSFQVGGEVTAILVQEGEQVQADAPLVQLDTVQQTIALRQSESKVAQVQANLQAVQTRKTAAEANILMADVSVTLAEAELALLQSEPLPEEIAVVESEISVAGATINQAAANRDLAISGASDAQIRAAEAELAAAVAQERVLQDRYDSLINQEILGTPEEQARFALHAAEANVTAAQAALEELNEGATEREQWAAQTAVAVAAAQQNTAQAQLDLLLAGTKEEQIAIAEVAVEQAKVAVTQAETALSQAEAAIAQAEAALLQAESERDAAQAALDARTLTAPFAGTVASLSVRVGEVVSSATPLLALADFSRWMVETIDLTEIEVVDLATGYKAAVRVDAIPGETLSGTVVGISRVGVLARGDITYVATIELEDTADLPLRWGMSVIVDVETDQ